ncbi:arylamine N-acetyltransferase [Sphaerisporangium sp. TRM90804]|uniref:arylamine N-acetyltransferase family protein n=1 Tax=Sphaerisporangium sp. TRM90804 TaxID=3031113 RepID=UPI0024498E0E|nr:arylamine N-acetyltransferase [Sphaerisporangium sp. TRM90804]MDH2428391.1 arylamine N-acetyltransferase [Sphaerisporangium sp. TRM90804]
MTAEMTIDPMLHRIGHHGPVDAGPETLSALHRAWRRAVPYENLDIQLGRPISLEPDALFDKLVRRRRGGYCYEQNAGLAMLLRLAGFEVTMVEAGVLRAARGEAMWGNHNALLVDLDGRRWLADAGIGDGFVEPLPLREGPHIQEGLTYRLERLDPGTWRFHHHPGGTIASYDFRLSPRDIADFAARSRELSTSAESTYVTTLMAARPAGGSTLVLLSRTLRRLGAGGRTSRTIGDLDEFARTLSTDFLVPLDDLGESGLARLWHKTGTQDDLWRTRVGDIP